MRPIYWKLCLTGLVGVGLGLFGGQATIAGMAPPAATTLALDAAYSDEYGAVSHADRRTGPDYAGIASDCDGCSDYDLGYRFAAARHVRESGDCMDFNWSYQRGCLAWLRES